MDQYYVYIMASRGRTLYIGVTNDLERRVLEHKEGRNQGFTARYSVSKLVYYDSTTDIRSAIAREKELKGWRRSKKVELVESVNPEWKELAREWYRSMPRT